MDKKRREYLKYFAIPVCIINTVIIALSISFLAFLFQTQRVTTGRVDVGGLA
jgi:hypothetical protein